MSGYSGTPLWKKLGYRDGMTVYVEKAPVNYRDMLQLPSEVSVQWVRRVATGISLVHLFTTSKSVLLTKLKSFRKTIDPNGSVWVSWPKKSAGVPTEVEENLISETALPLGFVDVKICAVDEIWSGLKLVIRKELR